MMASYTSESADYLVIPQVKRHCGHYSLVMLGLPAAVTTGPLNFWTREVQKFFFPMIIKGFGHDFTNTTNQSDKGTWTVNFFAEQDMHKALMEKQWQFSGNELCHQPCITDVVIP